MKENSGEDLTEPSEYELLRQRNIEKRKSLFQELNLNQVGKCRNLDASLRNNDYKGCK